MQISKFKQFLNCRVKVIKRLKDSKYLAWIGIITEIDESSNTITIENERYGTNVLEVADLCEISTCKSDENDKIG